MCLQDGDVISLGGDEALTVMYTPGHSPDSITLWDPTVCAAAVLFLMLYCLLLEVGCRSDR